MNFSSESFICKKKGKVFEPGSPSLCTLSDGAMIRHSLLFVMQGNTALFFILLLISSPLVKIQIITTIYYNHSPITHLLPYICNRITIRYLDCHFQY